MSTEIGYLNIKSVKFASSNSKLEAKISLITGGNSGIGLATARRYVAEGVHVFITGRRQAELGEAVRQIGKHVTGVPDDGKPSSSDRADTC